MIYLYLLIETINLIYTSRFGLKRPLDQPLAYSKVRMFLKSLKYITAVISAIIFFSDGNILTTLIIIVLPFLTEKALYSFCKKKALERLVTLYTNKEKMKKDIMEPKEAKEVASTIFESEVREGALTF